MSQIKIPSAPVSVLKRSTGNSTWVMEPTKRGSDMLLSRVHVSYRSGPPAFDGREYLEAFMAVREPKDALAFVNRFGSPGAGIDKWREITFSEFRALQNLVRIVARTALSEWPPKELSIGLNPERLALQWETLPFTFVHETDHGIEACCAQVFFEKLAGVEFRWCARGDCSEMFRKETAHNRIYCSPECGHVMAVRASRGRVKKTNVSERTPKRR
jgi:hypothetical protein